MQCTWPKPITDHDLLAYLTDEAPADIARHVKTCLTCRERARDLRTSEVWLRQMLYRVECPDAHIMSDFRQGFLARDEAQAVATHLARCPHCQAELAKLDRFLAAIEPSLGLGLLNTVRLLVARLVTWPQSDAADSAPAAPRLAYGAIRGQEDRRTQVYEAESYQVILDIELDPHRPNRHRLQGLVISRDGMAAGPLDHASLVGTETAHARVAVDDLGNFGFDILAPGLYDLTLTGPGLELRVEEIDLR